MLDSSVAINAMLNVKSHAKDIASINAKVAELDNILANNDDKDESWEQLSLNLISHIQDPIHNIILSWNDWWSS